MESFVNINPIALRKPKLHTILAFLSAIWLKESYMYMACKEDERNLPEESYDHT